MAKTQGLSIAEHFADLTDPRIERTRRHELLDIVTIALCAVISGAETWVDLEEYGRAKQAWLQRFLDLPHGIPSHDTFQRVISRLDPEQFQTCLLRWVAALHEATEGRVIALDGKTLRRSFDQAHGRGPLHLVSAWAAENHLVLGQLAVDQKSNEITAIPRLLEIIDVAGGIVTIDAMGCQTAIARTIRDQGADYVLALKANQPRLHEQVQAYFAEYERHQAQGAEFRYHETADRGHGRVERRRYLTAAAPQDLDPAGEWTDLRSIGIAVCERTVDGQTTTEARCYLSSLRPQVRRFAAAVRSHWSIENSLHWVLDVAFDEDHCRIRKDHGPENFALLRRLAASLLKHEHTSRRGIAVKRRKAAWDDSYLLKVLLASNRQ